jgi:hypothetical protein
MRLLEVRITVALIESPKQQCEMVLSDRQDEAQ